jgi:hypothetical protein
VRSLRSHLNTTSKTIEISIALTKSTNCPTPSGSAFTRPSWPLQERLLASKDEQSGQLPSLSRRVAFWCPSTSMISFSEQATTFCAFRLNEVPGVASAGILLARLVSNTMNRKTTVMNRIFFMTGAWNRDRILPNTHTFVDARSGISQTSPVYYSKSSNRMLSLLR